MTIDGLAIESSSTSGLGGGIANSGTLAVEHATFSGNTAGSGGALANAVGASLTVKDSTFSNNTTSGVGGGAIIDSGAATIERSAIVDNHAPINGGGINVQGGGTVTLDSSTVAGNTSGGLGGGLSNLGTITVQASTIARNTGSDGTAIATGNTNVTFADDIIASQPAGRACNPANASITDAGYNLDDDGTCISPTAPATGSHNGTTRYASSTYGAVLDAYLASALGNNGGPTQTLALLNRPNPATPLIDPAFDAVPASFDLPIAVDGVSGACAVPDQRGVVAVAGAHCAIGAYRLQATKTVLTSSAATAVVNGSVTYTATVTPAPDGGTVSFDDGAGNPATTHCAAQPISQNGTATCTVSYGSTGNYPVTATYSGDGAMNNFAGSANATQTAIVAAPASGPPPPAPPVPFALKVLSSAPSCIASSASGSNKLTARLRLSDAARVKLTLQRRVEQSRRPVTVCPKAKPGNSGSYGNVRKTAASAKGMAAAAAKVIGASLSSASGIDKVAVLKAMHAGKLAPGRYRVVVDATRADGRHATGYVFFRVLNPRPKKARAHRRNAPRR